MNILENQLLNHCNTLRLAAKARFFVEVITLEELQDALLFARGKQLPVVAIGGGSNVVFSSNIDAVVILIGLRGRSLEASPEGGLRVEAGAGENWHNFVRWTLLQGAFGLENLSLIPGTVGAAPIQNIGAYGVELKDCFYSLNALEVASGEVVRFFRDDCNFGYRDSVFKHVFRDRYIITSVQFELEKELTPRLDYGKLDERVEARCGKGTPSALLISDVVSEIRREKLPDPSVLGNAGSFFKNPVVNHEVFERLKQQHPDIIAYPVGSAGWKLAAGWLIERAGLKGYRQGAVGTHKQQALVIVNYGGASGADLIAFSSLIQYKVVECFGVELEREPRVY